MRPHYRKNNDSWNENRVENVATKGVTSITSDEKSFIFLSETVDR